MSEALVVSGGGAHGAFAVGVIKKLDEAGKAFDLVAGTSTGALITPLVATGEIELLESMYANAETDDLLTRKTGLDMDAVYATDGLRELIDTVITEARYERILDGATEVYLATVVLETAECVYWNPRTSGAGGGAMTREAFKAALLASASIPILMPPVPIGADHHVDGGVRDIAPLQVAIDAGANTIHAVVLSPEAYARKPLATGGVMPIFEIAQRTVGALTHDVVYNDVNTAQLYNRGVVFEKLLRERARLVGLTAEQVEALFEDEHNPSPFAGKRLLNLHLYRPETDLPVDALSFIPERMREMISLGERVAGRRMQDGPLPASEEVFDGMLAEMRARWQA